MSKVCRLAVLILYGPAILVLRGVDAGSREEIIQILEGAGYQRFHHTDDFNKKTQTNQNDLFVRHDIVTKYHVKQLY